MQYNMLGSSDLCVSEASLGTMTFGEQNTEAEGHEQMSLALEHGVNFFDTAEIYPIVPAAHTQGRTSEIIGSWLSQRPRDSVIIASKVAGRSTGLAWVPANRTDPPGPESQPVVDAPAIAAAAEGELRRLRTDHLDLLQIHWPDRHFAGFGRNQYHASQEYDATPVAEIVAAMAALVQQGKIRHWGLSNESSYGVMAHCAAADAAGAPRPVSVQNSFSLLHRSAESELAEVVSPRHMNMGLIPWSACAGGFLSGKYLRSGGGGGGGELEGCRMTRWPARYARFLHARCEEAAAAYADIARGVGCTPAQLAYAFCRSRAFVPTTLIGATSAAQLVENLGAFSVTLSDDTLAAIDDVHRRIRNPSLLD